MHSWDMTNSVSFYIQRCVLIVLRSSTSEIDYYGVTFDHLVPADDHYPEVLQINIVEIEADEGEYANEYLPFTVDPAEYIGKKILAVPRCCQKRKGTTDRSRVNGSVAHHALIREGSRGMLS